MTSCPQHSGQSAWAAGVQSADLSQAVRALLGVLGTHLFPTLARPFLPFQVTLRPDSSCCWALPAYPQGPAATSPPLGHLPWPRGPHHRQLIERGRLEPSGQHLGGLSWVSLFCGLVPGGGTHPGTWPWEEAPTLARGPAALLLLPQGSVGGHPRTMPQGRAPLRFRGPVAQAPPPLRTPSTRPTWSPVFSGAGLQGGLRTEV